MLEKILIAESGDTDGSDGNRNEDSRYLGTGKHLKESCFGQQ